MSTKEFKTETIDGEEVTWKKGDQVFINYKPSDGDLVLETQGELITIVNGEAYVETAYGPVVGDARTLERLDEQ